MLEDVRLLRFSSYVLPRDAVFPDEVDEEGHGEFDNVTNVACGEAKEQAVEAQRRSSVSF